MSNEQNTAFKNLLDGWRRHQDLRNSGASIDELFLSRKALDEYRFAASSAR